MRLCNLKCRNLVTVHKIGRYGKIVLAYCSKYDTTLPRTGGKICRPLICKNERMSRNGI